MLWSCGCKETPVGLLFVVLLNVFRIRRAKLHHSFSHHATIQHMVRNHQDGYPYINLALFFFFWKYPETLIYLVKMIGRWIPDGEGRGIARNIFLNIIFFSNFTKKVTMLGPFKRPEFREGSGKKLHFFSFFEKIQRFHFLW